MSGSVMGLVSAGSDSSMLHHPHQRGKMSSPGDRFIQYVDFDSPAYDRNNRVDIPVMDMVIDDLWVEFQVSSVATTSTPSFSPTATWINSNGVQLLYSNQNIYTMSEAEALIYPKMVPLNQNILSKRLAASNDVPVATRRTNNTAVVVNYMWLGPLLKIMAHAGPLSSYASKKWSIIIGLLPFNRIAKGGNATTATGGTINAMRLCCIGHRESGDNVQRAADALAGEGIRISFTQPNHQQSTYSSSATSHQVNLTALEGEATDLIISQRVTAGLTATAPNGGERDAFQNFPLAADTIEIGTQQNPTRVFGLAIPQRTCRLVQQGDTYSGGCLYVDPTGAQADEGWMAISLSEGGTLGQKFGAYSGSLRLKNNFQYILRFSTTTTANTVDTIVYVMRDLLLKHEGMVMLNREA